MPVWQRRTVPKREAGGPLSLIARPPRCGPFLASARRPPVRIIPAREAGWDAAPERICRFDNAAPSPNATQEVPPLPHRLPAAVRAVPRVRPSPACLHHSHATQGRLHVRAMAAGQESPPIGIAMPGRRRPAVKLAAAAAARRSAACNSGSNTAGRRSELCPWARAGRRLFADPRGTLRSFAKRGTVLSPAFCARCSPSEAAPRPRCPARANPRRQRSPYTPSNPRLTGAASENGSYAGRLGGGAAGCGSAGLLINA